MPPVGTFNHTLDLELESTMLSLLAIVEDSPDYLQQKPTLGGVPVLECIKIRAIDRWGEKKWLVELVREYVKITNAQGDEKATTINRRPQIERAFKVGSCTLDTAIVLAAAVGCKFQLHCTTIRVEVEEF